MVTVRLGYVKSHKKKNRSHPSCCGDTYTAHKWTRNMRTKNSDMHTIDRNGETNDTFQKHLYHVIQQTKIFKQCTLSFHNSCMSSVIICLLCVV